MGDVVAAAVAEAERLAARGWDGEGRAVQAERVEGEPYRSRKSGASRARRARSSARRRGGEGGPAAGEEERKEEGK